MFKRKALYLFMILTMTFSLFASLAPSPAPAVAAAGDPGKIEAENYVAMNGIQLEACAEGGQDIAYVDAGDWMDYAVNVQTAGTYNVDFRVSSPYDGTKLELRNGGTTLATVNVPNTGGYQTWQTVTVSATLPAGNLTLRVYAVTNGWNLNWLNFASATTTQPSGNLALNKPATESSHEANFVASAAFDGDGGTRWSSQFSDPQWIYVDLGSIQAVSRVKLTWEAAYGKGYQIQVSSDAANWTSVYTTTTGDGGVDDISFTQTNARYVRMYGTQRATGYGYSLYEFEVYGSGGTSVPQAVTIPVTGPYVQYLEMGLSPADLNQTSTLKSQNTAINLSMKYNVGTTVTIGVNYMVEQRSVVFRTTDANGNAVQGNPLTFTVHANSAVAVDVTDLAAAAAPTFAPAAGSYASAQDVTLASATAGATIHYTTDGSAPTAASPAYAGPIRVAATTTIRAIATKAGMADSAIVSATYTIGAAQANLALNKTATASTATGANTASLAFDGNVGTRWESQFSDPQWIYVDLGANKTVTGVKLNWETASAKAYKLQVSTDAANWTDVYSTANGPGGAENLTIAPVTARYVRMYGTARNTAYGYSLWEFEVYGQDEPLPPKAETPTISPAGGTYTTAQSVTLSSATAGATIKYTTDGSTPTAASPTYAGAINVTSTTTVRAIAIKSGMRESDVATAVFTIAGFRVLSPTNGQMVTSTRTPTLTWEAKAGAAKYEVWVNVSRTDYDWNASGNLLDRYTKVAEVTGTQATAPSLVDRWTYKWYVVAVGADGSRTQSAIGQFGVYLPYVEQVADGVNLINGMRDLNKNGTIEPYEDWHNAIETRVNDLMSRMTTEEKLHQLFFSSESLDNLDAMAGFVFSYGVTGFMTDAQKKVAQSQRLGIPIGFTGDKIQGWQTAFPTELGMAATRNLNLAWQVGDLQRREQKAWGFTGTLSPLAEVDTKVLYPRFQEGTGENADYSAAMLRAMIAGMQGGPEVNPKSLMITVKHWPSQGAGGEQSIVYDSTTIKWHMKVWQAAMDANPATVMPGYAGAPYLDPTGEGAGSSKPTLDYLRNVIGFHGVVMTDWLAAATDVSIKSIGAGADVMGGAPASGTDFNALINAVGMDRLNEATRRVLDLKFRLGMFENPYGDPDYPTTIWHSAESNNIVNEAARQSLTLLKNNGVLPLKPNNGDTIVVAGPRATSDDMANDNIANVIWQSIYHDNPAAKTYYQGIKDRAGTGVNVALNDATQAKAAVVVIGEKSYTHGTEWPDKQATIPADQVAAIDKFYNRGIPVVCVVVMPRPYVLTDILPKCAAVVAAYRPGNGGGLATAQLLFGDYLPTGKLPFQLPRSVDQVGTDNVADQKEKWDLPYDLGATDAERAQIRSYIANGQPVPTNFGNPLFPYGYGLQNFNPST